MFIIVDFRRYIFFLYWDIIVDNIIIVRWVAVFSIAKSRLLLSVIVQRYVYTLAMILCRPVLIT